MDPQQESWQGRLQYASLSDLGLRRANNQDSMAVMVAPSTAAWRQRGDLFVVADGMGAHAAGELASKLATDAVPLVYHKLAGRSPPEALAAAVQDANAQIHSRGQASPDFRGMGTTCTSLALLPQGAIVAHAGDSRAYRLRADRLEQLTFDHSLVWEIRASGQVQGPVPDYIPKNVITRSLGPNPSIQVDLEGPFPLMGGDTFLLCSDGLSGQVQDEEIGMILGCLPPADAVQALVDLANLRGGPDNITVIVVRAVGNAWQGGGGGAAELPGQTRPVHPAVWALAATAAVIAVGLTAVRQFLPAAVSFLAAVLLAGGGIVYRSGGGSAGPLGEKPLGRGPYTATGCTPNADVCRRLTGILGELREAATEKGWSVDWNRFQALLDQAAASSASGDFPQAVRCHCQAITFMMGELKRQGKTRNDLSK
ncbi:MAG: protein phosphatase 2C domain-containing protein [Thermoguttaceae bacterium]|jgi:protein phosphatase